MGYALSAQPDIRFEEVSSLNSLSHNSVTAIHQDQNGFLWIGTFNGLNKFDGYKFQVYKFNDLDMMPASTNRITAIHEDKAGRLWIKAYDGNYVMFNPLSEQFHSIELEEGFQSGITHYYESPGGIVCLSTEKSGVLFIDSKNLEEAPVIHHIFNRPGSDPSLSSNRVNFVIQDMNGFFWIGTENGLCRVHEDDLDSENPRVLKYFLYEPGPGEEGNAFTMAHLFEEKLWFANSENGISYYDPGTERFSNNSEYPTLNLIFGLKITSMASRGNKLWIGTDGGYLACYDEDLKQFRAFAINDSRSGQVIDEIYCDLYDQVWLLTENFGITRFDPSSDSFHYYRLAPENSQDLIDDERTKVFEDSKNNLWLAGQVIGIQYYNRETDKFSVYINDPGDPSSIVSNVVEIIMEDRENNIWIGTNWFGKGLSRMVFVNPAFKYQIPVPVPESKMQNVIRSIFVDSEGYTWAGSKSGQIYIYNKLGEQIEVIQKNPSSGYSGYNVYSILEDEKGYIWLCTKGAGIFISNQSVRDISHRYNRLTFTNIKHDPDNENSLSSNNTYDCEIDDLGRVWVATYGGGLNLIETNEAGELRFKNFVNSNSGLSSDNLRDLHLDRNGRLWLASTLGLSYLDIYKDISQGLEIKSMESKVGAGEGLSYKDIIMIMEDIQGNIWLATAGGGVNELMNPGGEEFRFRYFTESDGLKDDYILSLAQDRYGFIWIGTGSGLSRYNPVNGDIDNFDKKNGLPEVSFSERTAVSEGRGELLFGTSNGFYSISPDLIHSNEITPAICLTGFELNNTEVQPGDEDSPLDRSITYTKELSLSSRQSNFAISFSQMSFQSPESNHYAYMLEGFDEEWIYAGNNHKATFTNVPPGNYIFKVKGLDSDLSEYGPGSSLQISVEPPLWRSNIAILIYTVILGILIFLAYRLAYRFMRLKNNLRVEKMVAESKFRFFTNISHEIRTPLTLILGPVDNLIQKKQLQPEVSYQLSVIHRNTKRLLRMVNMILDFRKVQHEKINLRIQKIDLVIFLHQVFESFEGQARQKSIQFNLVYDQNDEDLHIWGDIQKLDIVFFNLLSNAFKFTPANRSISLIISRESESPDSIQIVVSDTGLGIDKDKLDHIFDRFFVSHIGEGAESHGTGIGLSLCQEYVHLHNGEITAESTLGTGTEFKVVLLTGKDHFPDDVDYSERQAYSYSPKQDEPEIEQIDESHQDLSEAKPKGRSHIIVVEDDTEMAFYIQQILEQKYEVDLARDGQEGLEMIRSKSPDIVVTDVMMPRMDGMELTRKLKEEFSTSHIPIIMLTSKSNVESQVEGLQIGAEAYVPKPFNTEVLMSYISSLLQQRETVQEILLSRIELKPDEVQVTPKDKQFIEKVMGLINDHLADPEFNVEKLAAMVYISRTLFYKKIKGITGHQPVELIRMIRLKKAAKYIETGEFTVSEVAYMVGYNDIRYFSTSFKKQFGVSPSQYHLSDLE